MNEIEAELEQLNAQIKLAEEGGMPPGGLDIMGSRGVTLFMKLCLHKFQVFETAINRLAERLDKLEERK